MRRWIIGLILVSMMTVLSSCREVQPPINPDSPLTPPAVIYDDQ